VRPPQDNLLSRMVPFETTCACDSKEKCRCNGNFKHAASIVYHVLKIDVVREGVFTKLVFILYQ